MTTFAQLRANRKNSTRSTGPRTTEGKAASSQNHTLHGLNSVDPVLPHEDRDQFRALHEDYRSTFKPMNAYEEFLVSQMAASQWKLNRVERIEQAIFAALDGPPDPAADPHARIAQLFMEHGKSDGFMRLDRYRSGLERNLHRSTRELFATREKQKKQNEPNSTQAAERKFEKLLERLYEGPQSASNPEPAASENPPAEEVAGAATATDS